jgi:hypothetical protein
MKCSRCEIQFTATSAMVKDHRYVQECIDALKAKVRELSRVPDVQPGPPCLPVTYQTGPNTYRVVFTSGTVPIQ